MRLAGETRGPVVRFMRPLVTSAAARGAVFYRHRIKQPIQSLDDLVRINTMALGSYRVHLERVLTNLIRRRYYCNCPSNG